MRRWTVGAAIVAAAALVAVADDEDDNPSSNDLPVLNPRRPYSTLGADKDTWAKWWYANRGALLAASYRAAGDAAGATTPPEADARKRGREALRAALASKNDLLASEAALALGRAGDPRDGDVLAPFVADEDLKSRRRVHRYAALGLGLLERGDAAQDAEAKATLLGALDRARGQRDRHMFFHANCAFALAMRGDGTALPELSDIRKKGLDAGDARGSLDSEILGPIVYALGVLGGESALPEIEAHLAGGHAAGGGTEDTAEAACQALARVGGPKARELLRRAATDPRERVRRCALMSLGAVAEAADDATAKALVAGLADKDPECRWMAAVSLARSRHADAATALLAAFLSRETPSSDRAAFAIALGLLARARPDETIARVLLAALVEAHDEDEICGLATACGLARVPGARRRLGEMTEKGRSPVVASYAAYALGVGGADAEQRKTLHELVEKSPDFMARREASLALGMTRDGQIVDRLRALATSASSSDLERATVVVSLGRVGSYADVDLFVALLKDPDVHDQLRACVAQGLGLLLDRRNDRPLATVSAESRWFGTVFGRMRWPPVWDVQRLVD